MRILSVAVAIVLGLCVSSYAAPLDMKHVAADAKWVMHLDVDAMRNSVVIEKAYHKCLQMQPEAGQHLDTVQAMIGMDLRTGLHGITCYGPQVGKHKGVLIVLGDMKQQVLLDKAKAAPGHQMTKYGDCELYTWTMKKGDQEHQATGAFFKPNVLVFSGTADETKAALDVLSGKAASKAGQKCPLACPVCPGAILLSRAVDVSPNIAKTRCPVIKNVLSWDICMGEDKGESFLHEEFVANTPEIAAQFKAVADGIKAVVSLNLGADSPVAKSINGASVTCEGQKLTVKWSAPAEGVWNELEKMGKHLAEMKAKHESHKKK